MSVILKKVFSIFLFMTFLVAIPGEVGITHASALADLLCDQYETELYGFVETRQGWRLQDDPFEKAESISEIRTQLELSRDLNGGLIKFRGDLVGDRVLEEVRGELRVFNISFSPLDLIDVKVGRQIQTWGTGDLLFINDLFPKDWQSFFIGRDDEYLKAPSDSIRTSLFFDLLDIDVSYSPVFNGSAYIDGSRLSYWNGARIAGRDSIFVDHERNRYFQDDEISVRLSKIIQGVELALYGYEGFWQTPEGVDPDTAKGVYPRLRSVGGSLRTPFRGGITNIEAGYYDSPDDSIGNDPFIRNSEVRFLGGYERELGSDFTGGLKYYLEWMLDYDEYRLSLLTDSFEKDEYRHVLTLRLTKLMMNQNLTLSLFAYYSPSDRDAYLRPKIHYKVSDRWAVETGGNIFSGAEDHTFFGQFQNNTNVYAGVRYSF
jgi:hypothetical protein